MKTSRKILYRIFLALILVKAVFFTNELAAQPARGVYLNAPDFVNGKLSYTNLSGKKCRIKIHASSRAPIKIICGDSVIHLYKDSVYGYKDKENISHRFYKKNIYEILNPSENILLYRLMISGKTKYEDAIYNYYFSKNAQSGILPLDLQNVEAAFDENKLLLDFIEIHFKTDSDLTEYDPIHKKYKLNRLLELSTN
ncbi:MAG: hypothetical protein ACXVPN_08380 [Bacteroidia bacterium]